MLNRLQDVFMSRQCYLANAEAVGDKAVKRKIGRIRTRLCRFVHMTKIITLICRN